MIFRRFSSHPTSFHVVRIIDVISYHIFVTVRLLQIEHRCIEPSLMTIYGDMTLHLTLTDP